MKMTAVSARVETTQVLFTRLIVKQANNTRSTTADNSHHLYSRARGIILLYVNDPFGSFYLACKLRRIKICTFRRKLMKQLSRSLGVHLDTDWFKSAALLERFVPQLSEKLLIELNPLSTFMKCFFFPLCSSLSQIFIS